MLPAVLVSIGAMAVAAALAYGTWVRSRRQAELPAVARRAGLDYSDVDRFNSLAVPFALFRAGHGRTVEHVMWRQGANGQPVRVFDYSWYTEHRDQQGQVQRRWSHHTCATGQHNGPWPEMEITRERVIDRIGQKLGLPSVDLESEEFNRTFMVRCDDERFATDLLSPQMMEFLLTTEGRISFFTKGRFVLAATSRLDAPLMPGLLAVVDEFIARIPPLVYELYGRSPDGHGTEDMPPPPGPTVAPPRAGLFGLQADGEQMGPSPFEFAPPPDHRRPDPLDPTPGVDHDLDGNPLPPAQEDPWGEGRAGSGA